MKILIWGIPCVGKTDVGKLLANKLNYKYFDMNDILKEKYGTINKFLDSFSTDDERYKEEENVALDIINNNDNFVMSISLIRNKDIVDKITNTDCISLELIDNALSIYDKIVFYDDEDNIIPESKEYRDANREKYLREVINDQRISNHEYKDIPKFDLEGMDFEYVIDELSKFVDKLANKDNTTKKPA